MQKRIVEDIFRFVGAATPGSSADNGPFKRSITGAAPPTVTTTAAGIALALTATNQEQNAGLNFGDILSYDIDDLVAVEFIVAMTASFAGIAHFGVGSAINNDIEAMTAFAAFKLNGNNTILVTTDDGTNDLSNKSTGGIALTTTKKQFVIDFASGVSSRIGSASKGGKACVQFLCDDARGYLRRVAADVEFDLSNYSAGLQPMAAVYKASGTGTGTMTIEEIRVRRRQG